MGCSGPGRLRCVNSLSPAYCLCTHSRGGRNLVRSSSCNCSSVNTWYHQLHLPVDVLSTEHGHGNSRQVHGLSLWMPFSPIPARRIKIACPRIIMQHRNVHAQGSALPNIRQSGLFAFAGSSASFHARAIAIAVASLAL